MVSRSRALQIYMKPGVREDEILLRVWESAQRNSRPQDVFRAMLRAGLRAMTESGELPDAIVTDCDLDAWVDRLRHRRGDDRRSAAAAHPTYLVPAHAVAPPMAPAPTAYPPYAAAAVPAPAAPQPAPATEATAPVAKTEARSSTELVPAATSLAAPTVEGDHPKVVPSSGSDVGQPRKGRIGKLM